MSPRSEVRRLRVYRVDISGSELSSSASADIWQDEEGRLRVSGLWEGLVPSATEDIEIQARAIGISPVEWLKRRLMQCSFVRVEVI